MTLLPIMRCKRRLIAWCCSPGCAIVATGFAIWKPVQLQWLTAAFGGFDNARLWHFIAMAVIVLFFLVHVTMALLVPKSLRAMIRGY